MKPSEVTHINRQKYMAELSKLLAFMFKEDKEDILAQYNKMLDEADDEQALLESFGSPTKLAVTISRTYKRSERKLAVEADSKEDKPEATEHIIVTPVKREKEKPSVTDTGLSYADIIEEIRREKAAEEGVEYKPMFYDEPEETAVQEELEETPAEETQTEETITEQEPAEESAPVEEAAPEEAEGKLPKKRRPLSNRHRRRKRKLYRRKLLQRKRRPPRKSVSPKRRLKRSSCLKSSKALTSRRQRCCIKRMSRCLSFTSSLPYPSVLCCWRCQ